MKRYVEDRSEATVGSGCIGHTNRTGRLTVDRSRRAGCAIDRRRLDRRYGVMNVGANLKVASSLVLLLKELVGSRFSVGDSNGVVVDVSLIKTLGTSRIPLLPLH